MTAMIKVGIVGSTGYTARELFRILDRHPRVTLTKASSRLESPTPLYKIHPSLVGSRDLLVEDLSPKEVATDVEVVFCCLPHRESALRIPEMINSGARVVDLSADYRLNEAATFEKWYDTKHPDPDRVPLTIYGMPEFFAQEIRSAQLVANPGCYPTSAILALAPFLKEKIVSPAGLIIDSKSGVTGAGRSPKQETLFSECNETLTAYGVGTHRHLPEIEQILGNIIEDKVETLFTPHLVPMNRGILTVAYAPLIDKRKTEAELLAFLKDFYQNSPFVRIVTELPTTKNVTNTNYCEITVRKTGGYLTILSVIDNLIKGAAGTAVHNMNLMFG
ncbi:MAG: N-acetyl-gamma-glutamyl-phosphate reductase, partial [Pirellulaceae bacterium]|nr:N-acetyl-gamma-glutamyl-phosphate reductase [Pirellulaceae bacterium]